MLADLAARILPTFDALASTVLGGVLTYLIHSTILIAVVWIVTSRRSPFTLSEKSREALWKIALVGGLVTATIQSVAGVQPLGGSMQLFAQARDQLVRQVHVLVRRDQLAPGIATRDVAATRHPSLTPPKPMVIVKATPSMTIPWSLMALALLAIASATSVMVWVVGRRRALRSLGHRRDIRFSVTGNAMRELCQRAGVREFVSLSVSSNTGSPLALPGGEICLPARALHAFDPITQEVILAHELAHVVRRDAGWLDFARAIEAACFFQPLNRLARRRIQESAEILADDWAVARTKRPLQLAQCLAQVAEWVSRDAVPAAVPAMVESGGSALVQRVRRLANGEPANAAPATRHLVMVGGLALAVLACVAPRVSVGSAQPAGTVLRTIAMRVPPPAGATPIRLSLNDDRNVRILRTAVQTDTGIVRQLVIEEWDGQSLKRTVRTLTDGEEWIDPLRPTGSRN